MSLLQKIDNDLKQAMRQKETHTLEVLRMLKSAIKYDAIQKSGADTVPTDADVIAVIRKEIKKRHDAITSYTQGGRTDLADKERKELDILQSYLPPALSHEELESLVQETIRALGATSKKQMGEVMKALQAKTEGRADGKTLAALVQKHLT
ncbi:MAG: GatB/YqeY domain-containing protein [Methylacidiphilales bacterium]|nr:GatB/YqeY domain-containing protein [Candidatus Methylacidiphilales bacterium]MDW8349502.1 GatB/YqeY domain-containing protein [Verrucomicrobiae bacterium]